MKKSELIDIIKEELQSLNEGSKKYIFGHDSMENAYVIEDYPYGRLRTQMRVWIETNPKRGDRVIRQTLNPKTQRWNKPKASTYDSIAALYIEPGTDHIKSNGITFDYASSDEVKNFVKELGGEGKLNKVQKAMYDKVANPKSTPAKLKWEKVGGELATLIMKYEEGTGVQKKQVFEDGKATLKKYAKKVKELIDNDGHLRIVQGRNAVLVSQDAKSFFKLMAKV